MLRPFSSLPPSPLPHLQRGDPGSPETETEKTSLWGPEEDRKEGPVVGRWAGPVAAQWAGPVVDQWEGSVVGRWAGPVVDQWAGSVVDQWEGSVGGASWSCRSVFLLRGRTPAPTIKARLKGWRKKGGVARLTAATEEADGQNNPPKPQALITGPSVLRRAPADYGLIPPIPRQQQDVAPQSTAQLRPAASLQMCVLIAEQDESASLGHAPSSRNGCYYRHQRRNQRRAAVCRRRGPAPPASPLLRVCRVT